jgi:ribosome biogenesis protein Nip4
MYLGEIKDKKFAPTFTLLDMLKKTNQYICVNKKAAWLYLCKRDILKDSIIIKRGLIEDEVKMKKLKEHGLFLVKDEENKILGLGKVKFIKSSWFVKNILDRGNYLRKENK